MPHPGAQQRAHPVTCSYPPVIPPAPNNCHAERHDTRVAYDTYGCRCPAARAASSRAREGRRARQLHGGRGLVPADGTVRRLRALAAIGHTMTGIAAELGWEWQRVADLRAHRRPRVNVATHRAVTAVYDRLADTPGPSTRARSCAARRGWLGPLWWDDDTIDDPAFTNDFINSMSDHDSPRGIDRVAIDRHLAGDRSITLNRNEKVAALHQLLEAGRSLSAAAERLGINGTYALKYAAEAGIDVGAPRNHARTNGMEATG